MSMCIHVYTSMYVCIVYRRREVKKHAYACICRNIHACACILMHIHAVSPPPKPEGGAGDPHPCRAVGGASNPPPYLFLYVYVYM